MVSLPAAVRDHLARSDRISIENMSARLRFRDSIGRETPDDLGKTGSKNGRGIGSSKHEVDRR